MINWDRVPDTFQPRDSQGRFLFKRPIGAMPPPKFPSTKEYTVLSYNNGGSYKVMRIERVTYTCTCPDHRFRQRDCKHIRQVQIF